LYGPQKYSLVPIVTAVAETPSAGTNGMALGSTSNIVRPRLVLIKLWVNFENSTRCSFSTFTNGIPAPLVLAGYRSLPADKCHGLATRQARKLVHHLALRPVGPNGWAINSSLPRK
jgi:hypothetical protein